MDNIQKLISEIESDKDFMVFWDAFYADLSVPAMKYAFMEVAFKAYQDGYVKGWVSGEEYQEGKENV